MMNAPTEYPTLTIEGRTYVLLPIEEFATLTGRSPRIPEGATPWEIVKRTINEDISKVRAWREYLGLSQAEVAERMGVTQAAVSQLESAKRPRKATLEKFANALGLSLEQVRG